jgi:hypothetical protein
MKHSCRRIYCSNIREIKNDSPKIISLLKQEVVWPFLQKDPAEFYTRHV